ncbi:MAG: polyprenyl synthetase family protein [Gemmatimonadota bacterium]|nr:polyprenyl synthetase family protein [Gemmatimonadota bacterium]
MSATAEPVAVTERRAEVEAALVRFLDDRLSGVPAGAAAPIRYAVLSPGKRVRPLLLIASYRAARCALGRPPAAGDAVADLACSVELVHAYSLVHDDLPCMDDDVLRRGRPTAHVQFGAAAALLAGAALMPLAVEAILCAAVPLGLTDGTVRRLVGCLCAASGATGMVGGQLLDLEAEGREVTAEGLEAIHSGKTARLIAASVAMGGIAAGLPPGEDGTARLERFGLRLGLAFQAIDDILDLRGDTRELGKEQGRDAALRKATYPGIFGLEEAERIGRELAGSAERELDGLPAAEELRLLVRYIIDRRH